MDLASPAVSGTSVYANGLIAYTDNININYNHVEKISYLLQARKPAIFFFCRDKTFSLLTAIPTPLAGPSGRAV